MHHLQYFESYENPEDAINLLKKINAWEHVKYEYDRVNKCVNIDGNFDLADKYCKKLLVKIGEVNGHFICNNGKLETLENFPHTVYGNFDINYNNIKSLEHAPQYVESNFKCEHNRLTSLIGGPSYVGGNYIANYNDLTSLEGSPKTMQGSFYCHDNYNLKNLKGGPDAVVGYYVCSNCDLTSLEGAPKRIGLGFDCQSNKITTLVGGPEIVGTEYNCNKNQIVSMEGAPLKAKSLYAGQNKFPEFLQNKLDAFGYDYKLVLENLPVWLNKKLVDTTDKTGIFENSKYVSDEIIDFMTRYNKNTVKYKMNKDGSLNVYGDIDMSDQKIKNIPFKFDIIEGDFLIGGNNLTSLENFPKIITGKFDVSHNFLKTLKGGPLKVGGNYHCMDNGLTNLDHVAVEIGGSFDASTNKLEDLKGLKNTKIKGSIFLSNNKIISLEGAPEKIRLFDVANNKLTSLEGGPIETETYIISRNVGLKDLSAFDGAPEIVTGAFWTNDCGFNKYVSKKLRENSTNYEAIKNNIKLWCNNKLQNIDSKTGIFERMDIDGNMRVKKESPIAIMKRLNRNHNGYEPHYKLDDDGLLIVTGDVDLTDRGLLELPVKFKKVDGNFNVSHNKLRTLEGCPEITTGHFSCKNNKIVTLENGPKRISENFDCDYNNLTSLEHAPKVGHAFSVASNHLTTLKGAPEECYYFDCSKNYLKTLEYGPKKADQYDCSNNQLTDLTGAPEIITDIFDAAYNKFPKEVAHMLARYSANYPKILANFDIWMNPKLKNANDKTGIFDE